MKALRTVGLVLAILASGRLSGAQVLNEDVGVPLGGSWNPGTPIVIIKEAGTEDQVTRIGDPEFFGPAGISSTLPGDLILANIDNPGGDANPSNWLADIRFFNPLDPTGTLGLPATETEAFFPSDLGSGGFGTFQLMPDFNIVPGGNSPGFPGIAGTGIVYGPVGGIISAQEGVILFSAYPGAQTASTPEPGALALLFGVGVVGAGLLVRRQCKRTKPSAFLRSGNSPHMLMKD